MQFFEDAKNSQGNDVALSIVFGNGFSQAWDRGIFNYSNLLEAADFGERDRLLKSLFERFDTYDFETIMRSLEATEEVLNVYGGCSEPLDQITSDKTIIKESSIAAISSTHSDVPDKITDAQYVAVRNFISSFENIFTMNCKHCSSPTPPPA